MHAVFWIMTLLMTAVALLFVLTPLARARRRNTPALLAIAMPAFATLTYLALGSPGVTQPGHRGEESAVPARVGSVSSLADALATRLEAQPDDGESWLLLAKSYVYLGRLNDARHAYARAAALGQSDDALNHQFAATDSATSDGIAGRVSLSPVAEELVEPGDTVFVFARAPGQAGAPVAVVRQTVDAWPVEFRLTDAQSKTDGVRLSDLEQVVITARISRRGDASTALRSLEAKSQPITIVDTAPVYLTIK